MNSTTQLFNCDVNGIEFRIEEATNGNTEQTTVWAIGTDRGSKFYIILGQAPMSKAEIISKIEHKLTRKAV